MALNKDILKKLGEKTKKEKPVQELLVDIFQYESSPKGWYTKKYKELLEKHVEEQKWD